MKTALVCVVLLAAGAAWADIAPPDLAGCTDKKAGDECKRDDGSAATCVTATCSRNDYSNGPPPKSVSYECLQCTGPVAEKKCAVAPGVFAGLAVAWLLRRRRVQSRA
ncbi:MAG: hypothetical protein U0228_34800 [Myxococcaceae bacterium]